MGACASSLPKGEEYDGQVSRGKRHGRGIYRWRNGNWYDGTWVKNEMHGDGAYYYGNGDVYHGHFEHNKKQGKGVLIYADGSKYEGAFLDDVPSGRGVLHFANGDIYEGDFKHGLKNGQGIEQYAVSGAHYEGYFENHVKCGFGIMEYKDDPDGRIIYQGEWIDDLRHGRGTLTFVHKGSYAGRWRQDLYEGQGVLITEKGEKFSGEFVKGEFRSGTVEFVGEMRHTYMGEMTKGRKNGRGKEVMPDGSIYEGEFADGQRHGNGSLRLKTGEVYTGRFENGSRVDGVGVYVYTDGTRYEGQFVDGKRHGHGRLVYPNGNTYEGEFVDDLQHCKDAVMTFVCDGDDEKLATPEICHCEWVRGSLKHTQALTLAALRMAAAMVAEAKEKAEAEIAAYRKQLRRPEDICVRCNENDINALFLDCNHRVSCVQCAEGAKTCFVCNEAVTRFVRTYGLA